jgi:hypothetical protein
LVVPRRWVLKLTVPGLVALVAFLWFSGVGRDIQVQLYRGDVRYRFLGITYSTDRQPDYVVARLRLATELPPPVRERWVSCAGSPSWRYVEYNQASAWCEFSPRFGRFVLDDLAEWQEWLARGSPIEYPLVWYPDALQAASRDASGRWFIPPDWRESQDMEVYLERKGEQAGQLLSLEPAPASRVLTDPDH